MEEDELDTVEDIAPEIPQPSGTPDGEIDSATHDESAPPRHYIRLSDVYEHTSEIELEEELLLIGIDEPVCFEQAVKEEVWRRAMDKEIDSIKKNQTWTLKKLPTGNKPIDLKWVFK